MARHISKTFDFAIIIPTVFLLGMGLVVLQSISSTAQYTNFSMATQYVAVLIGLIAMFLISKTDSRVWIKIGPWLYWLSVFLLVLTLAFGDVSQGAQRWLDIGSFQIQPSEIGKFGLIAMLARLLSKRQKGINQPWTMLLSGFYVALPTALVLMQPDLSTSVVYIAIWFGMLTVSYLRTSVLLAMLFAMLAAIPLLLPALENYQQDRVDTFLDPTSDPSGKGYNIIQSTIAVGSGGLFGKGLDSGSQSQLNFLPSQHTDFLFAVTSEKLGLLGAMAVIIAFAVLLGRLLYLAWGSQRQYNGYVLFAVFVVLAMQVVVNIGMNIGLVPVTGLPLPLMSYGGTHIITELCLIGLALSTLKSKGA